MQVAVLCPAPGELRVTFQRTQSNPTPFTAGTLMRVNLLLEKSPEQAWPPGAPPGTWPGAVSSRRYPAAPWTLVPVSAGGLAARGLRGRRLLPFPQTFECAPINRRRHNAPSNPSNPRAMWDALLGNRAAGLVGPARSAPVRTRPDPQGPNRCHNRPQLDRGPSETSARVLP